MSSGRAGVWRGVRAAAPCVHKMNAHSSFWPAACLGTPLTVHNAQMPAFVVRLWADTPPSMSCVSASLGMAAQL